MTLFIYYTLIVYDCVIICFYRRPWLIQIWHFLRNTLGGIKKYFYEEFRTRHLTQVRDCKDNFNIPVNIEFNQELLIITYLLFF